MSSLWPSTITSLNDSLAALHGSLGKLKSAKSVEVTEVIEQLKAAAECSRNLRALVLAELPEASWQSREELDAIVEEISKRVEARAVEQMRTRLLSLATELDNGIVVHRRVVRATQVNQMREAAVRELRARAKAATPPALPGPEAHEWIEWGCNLQEPHDAVALQNLKTLFPALDEFIANLEPDMWTQKTDTTA
jgi:hypothetical protein